MAQNTVSEIAQLLNDMRVENEHNADNFEKVLAGINTKLELMSDDSEKADLIRIYISELKKAVDEKHGKTLVRLDELQESFQNIMLSINGLNIEDSIKIQMQNLLKDLTAQIDFVPQRISFSNVEKKIEEIRPLIDSLNEIIQNSSDKNSNVINENFQKLQNQFENIVTDSDFRGFKSDLADFVQKIIDNSSALNSELSHTAERIENILTTVKSFDFKDDFENITQRIENIREVFENGSKINYGNLSSELSELSKNFNESFASLDSKRQAVFSELKLEMNAILENLTTLIDSKQEPSEIVNAVENSSAEISNLINTINENADSNYEAIKDYVEELSSNISLLQTEFKEVSKNNSEKIVDGITGLSSEFNTFKDEFYQNARAGVENSSKFAGEISLLADKVSNLEETVSEKSSNNFESLKSILENLTTQLALDFDNQRDLLSNQSSDLEKLESISKLSEDIKNIENVLSDNNIAYQNTAKNYISEIKEYLNEMTSNANKIKIESDDKLFAKLEVLGLLNNTFESSINSLDVRVKDVIDNLTVSVEADNIIKSEIDNLKNNLAEMSSNLEVSRHKSDELAVILSSLIENVANKDNFKDISDKLDNLDNSYDIQQIFSKLDDISLIFENSVNVSLSSISDKIDTIKYDLKEDIKNLDNSSLMLSKLDDFSYILSAIKGIVEVSANSNAKSIEKQIENFESNLKHIFTVEEFSAFQSDFKDFVQKIIDSTNISNVNSDILKEKISDVLEKFESINYSGDFENIANRLNDIKLSLENNSKMNYESIINEINNLKSEINSNFKNNDNYSENINAKFEELMLNIKMLGDTSSQLQRALLDDISVELNNTFQEMCERLNSGSEVNFGEIKLSIEGIISELDKLKLEIETNKESEFISSNFDKTNIMLTNITSVLNSISSDFEDRSLNNFNSITDKFETLYLKLDELKSEINDTDYAQKAVEAINDLSLKIDESLNNLSYDEKFMFLKEAINSLSSEIQISKEESNENIKENNKLQTVQLQSISENVLNVKEHIYDATESLKNYISELNSVLQNNSLSENLSQKLVELETILSNNSENNEQRIISLQEKLSEFAHIVENSNSDTEGKIATSIDEISSIKDELITLNEVLKSSKLSQDEKFSETISLLDAGVENITFGINSLNENVKSGLDLYLKESVDSIEEKFTKLTEIYFELKNQYSFDELTEDFDEKVVSLNSELKSVFLELNNSLYQKSEEIVNAFEPIKANIEEFVGFDFEKLVSDLKSQLELSFMNFNVDVNSEFVNQQESFKHLEDSYKEVYIKISEIEDYLMSNIQSNIELLNNTIETNVKSITYNLNEKFIEGLDELKSHIDISTNNAKLSDIVFNLRNELLEKFDKMISEQNNISIKHENIVSGISSITTNIQDYIAALSKAIVEKYNPEKTTATLADIKQDLKQLNSKADVIVTDTSLESVQDSLEQVHSKLDVIVSDTSIESVQDSLEQLHSKLDVIAMDNSNEEIQESFNDIFYALSENVKTDEFREKYEKLTEILSTHLTQSEFQDEFDKIHKSLSENISAEDIKDEFLNLARLFSDYMPSEELQRQLDEIKSELNLQTQLTNTLNAINSKVDQLSEDNANKNVLDEINDIKNTLLQHRKFYEESSDEKAAAIDKYLRDVLLKLDNVDIEKNADDIKNSILNALISVTNQISFVEESEDIKDFVEEKTIKLEQSLNDVQNQLRQIASSNDDFEYTYTLQDVESDIARLRIAINNISGSDLDDINEEISKIVNSIENIESSLTQDQANNLKEDIEKLNDEIISISTRTNKLLLNSDESYKVLNEGLSDFSNLICKLDDRISYLDNTEISKRIERKIDNIHSLAVGSSNADKIIHQVMMYLGEWIDSTTDNISSILNKEDKNIENTYEISDNINALHQEVLDSFSDIQNSISNKIRENIPSKEDIVNEIKELIPDNNEIIEKLKTTLDRQEERIESLENKLDRLMSKIDEKDDMVLNRKMDKFEKMLSGLNANIEKLTSYVDE